MFGPASAAEPLHRAVGVELPAHLAGLRLERPDVAVPVSEVDDVADDERRGFVRPGRAAPQDLPRGRVDRVDLAVGSGHGLVAVGMADERLEDHVVGDRGRRPAAATRVEVPAHLAGLRVEREELALEGRQVEASEGDRGWELEQRAVAERPHPAEGRPDRDRRRAQPLRVEAPCRPHRAHGLGLGRHRRLRHLGGDELDRRGALDVAPMVCLRVEVGRALAHAGQQQHDDARADQDLPPHRRGSTAQTPAQPKSRSREPFPDTAT